MYKPLADSTLLRMPKKEIIELLRTAEHNAKVSQEWVAQQAENLKDWKPVVHARWIHSRYEDCSEQFELVKCSQCNHEAYAMAFYVRGGNYCPACGAKMDGGDNDAVG